LKRCLPPSHRLEEDPAGSRLPVASFGANDELAVTRLETEQVPSCERRIAEGIDLGLLLGRIAAFQRRRIEALG
jgi:hypothetical protein